MVGLNSLEYLRRVVCSGLVVVFVTTSLMPGYAQEVLLPEPGKMVSLSPSFVPPVLK